MLHISAERAGLLSLFEHKLKNSSDANVDILTLIDDETIIIPGHGDLANKRDYRDVHNAVMGVRDGVKKALKTGQNLNQILALNLAKNYDNIFGNGFIKGDALIKTMFEEFK